MTHINLGVEAESHYFFDLAIRAIYIYPDPSHSATWQFFLQIKRNWSSFLRISKYQLRLSATLSGDLGKHELRTNYKCSVQFSQSVVSNSLSPHGLQHARLPCPSPTPGAYSNSCWATSDTINIILKPMPTLEQVRSRGHRAI